MPHIIKFDEIDYVLLNTLQQDGRISNAELARLVGLSASGLQKRLKKLEERGLIERYVAVLNRKEVGFDMVCFILVSLQTHVDGHVQQFHDFVNGQSQIVECNFISGEYDYLLKLIVYNKDDLQDFLVNKLIPLGIVDRSRTSIVINEIKSTTAIPVEKESKS